MATLDVGKSFPVRVLVPAAGSGPLAPRTGLEIQRAEPARADHRVRIPRTGRNLASATAYRRPVRAFFAA